MKKNNILVILAILFHMSCASSSYLKLKTEISSKPAISIGQYKEIIMTNFLLEKEVKDFNLNQELINYFRDEWPQKFKGKLILKNISWEKEDIIKDQSFWKQAAPDSKDSLYFTGKALFAQEIRKALLKKDRVELDGPFVPEKSWAEQKTFSLKLSLFLVKAETGEIFFERDYQETSFYKNLKQPAEFAFYDLIKKVKLKFFREIFEMEKIQERFLLSK